MPREAPAAHSLRRATSALDGAAASLVAMRSGALDRCLDRLQETAATLSALVSSGIPAEQKNTVADSARVLKQRFETVHALVSALDRFFGTRAASQFQTYTADGETESLHPTASLIFEL